MIREPREEAARDRLRAPDSGTLAIRGGAVRGVGYLVGLVLGAAISVLLLRHLGVVQFGRYATVAALLAIVSGITDAGLTAVGARELSVLPEGLLRERMLASLVALRLVITPLGVAAAVAFAAAAGYDRTLVLGTLLGGIGVVLVNAQATMMLPLSVELRIVRVTVADVLRNVLTLAGVALLVGTGASLLPFFAIQIAVGVGVLAVTPVLVGSWARMRPALGSGAWRPLMREALPLAVALAMNVVYYRVLVILMSLMASGTETGEFATSLRIFEVLLVLPSIVLSIALPILSVAGVEDLERLRFALQRMLEVGMLVAVGLALVVIIPAAPVVRLLGGAQFEGAAPVLRVHAIALIGLFAGQVWQLGLLAVRRQTSVAVANAGALVVVLSLGAALVPNAGAVGAGIAAAISEGVLAGLLLVGLVRANRRLLPDFAFVWRIAVAGAAAAAASAAPGLPAAAAAALALVVYAAVALALRAVPSELVAALAPRRGRGTG
jgi:O-antigen/teichoic acid export membrane protein